MMLKAEFFEDSYSGPLEDSMRFVATKGKMLMNLNDKV